MRDRRDRAAVTRRVRRAIAAARPLHRCSAAYWVPSDGAGKGVQDRRRRSRGGPRPPASRFEGGVDRHRVRHRRRPHPRGRDRRRAGSSASACCSAPASGGRRSARWPASRSRSSRCSTSSCGPTRCPSSRSLQGDTWAQHPIVRHQDMSLYFRQRDDHYGVGNYRHEPIVDAAVGDPRARRRDAALADAVHARGLRPVRGRDRADVPRARRAGCGRATPSASLNGMFSFTPDAGSVVGESATVRGFWVCEAVWVTHAAGMARQAVEWMVDGEPTLRPGRGRREPLLPVPDDGAVRDRARQAAVPRGLRHPASAPAAVEAAEHPADAVLRAACRARRVVRHRRRVGAPAVVRSEPRAGRWRDPRVGAPLGLGGTRVVADRGRRAPRGARGAPGCST